MVDDGSGQVDVFRIENNSLVQVCVTFFPKVNPLGKIIEYAIRFISAAGYYYTIFTSLNKRIPD